MQRWANTVSQNRTVVHSARIVPRCLLLEQRKGKADLRRWVLLCNHHKGANATRQGTQDSADRRNLGRSHRSEKGFLLVKFNQCVDAEYKYTPEPGEFHSSLLFHHPPTPVLCTNILYKYSANSLSVQIARKTSDDELQRIFLQQVMARQWKWARSWRV